MDSQICLTLLPTEVLDLIFQRLDLNDKLQLAQADPRLGQAFAVHSRKAFALMDTFYIPCKYWPEILPLCGSTVRQIITTLDTKNCIPFHLIESQCPFLESIKLNVNSQNRMQITALLLNLKSLKSAYLYLKDDCDASVDIISALMQLPNLTKLLLHNYHIELVSQLKNLIYLEDLSLNIRSHSQALNIFEILSALQNLRSLHISNMNIMEVQNSCFNELQDLVIVACHLYSMLPHVPKLKSLRFINNSNHSQFQLSNWIYLHASTLEFLELLFPHFRNENINFLLEMLKKFTNLRTLQLDNPVTRQFVERFMDLLKSKGFSPERPFHLVLENFESLKSLFFESPYLGMVCVRSPSPCDCDMCLRLSLISK